MQSLLFDLYKAFDEIKGSLELDFFSLNFLFAQLAEHYIYWLGSISRITMQYYINLMIFICNNILKNMM